MDRCYFDKNHQMHAELDGNNYNVVSNDSTGLWLAEDICQLLKIKNFRQAISKLNLDEKREITVLTDASGLMQKKIMVVNFNGLCSLMFLSEAPIAKKFIIKGLTVEVIEELERRQLRLLGLKST